MTHKQFVNGTVIAFLKYAVAQLDTCGGGLGQWACFPRL